MENMAVETEGILVDVPDLQSSRRARGLNNEHVSLQSVLQHYLFKSYSSRKKRRLLLFLVICVPKF
jgi:hypothetical protein